MAYSPENIEYAKQEAETVTENKDSNENVFSEEGMFDEVQNCRGTEQLQSGIEKKRKTTWKSKNAIEIKKFVQDV